MRYDPLIPEAGGECISLRFTLVPEVHSVATGSQDSRTPQVRRQLNRGFKYLK